MCMRYRLAIALLLVASAPAFAQPSFLDEQLGNRRVREAFSATEKNLKELFASRQLAYPPKAILLRAFKHEGALELWAKGADNRFALVKSYPICARSGALGPKEIEGDNQVPEGFYEVSVFNPHSNFHLSLGVSYPNAADRVRTGSRRPGGAIMIHGDCVTIGCIPITDARIEEVYLAAVLARNAGQRSIPIHIFPARLDEAGWQGLVARPEATPKLTAFWSELKPAFEAFEATHQLPRIQINRGGHYVVAH